jgi:hypothetical protein
MQASLAVLCLLLSVAPAYAECAWVMWTEVKQKYHSDSPHARNNEQYPKWEFDTNVLLTQSPLQAGWTSKPPEERSYLCR